MENKEMIMDEVVNTTEEVVSKGLNKGLIIGGVIIITTAAGAVVYKKIIKPRRDAKKAEKETPIEVNMTEEDDSDEPETI